MKRLRDLLARLFRRRGAEDVEPGEDPRDVRLTAEARGHAGGYLPQERDRR